MEYIFRSIKDGGNLYLQVAGADGNIVWQVEYPSLTEQSASGSLIEDPTLMELGVLKDSEDVAGIERLLKSENIIASDDIVVSEAYHSFSKREAAAKVALTEASKLLQAFKDQPNLPLYMICLDEQPEEVVKYIAEQAQSIAVGKVTIHAKEVLEKRFGVELVALCIAAFPQGESFAHGGTIMGDTVIIPELIADQVATKYVEVAKPVKGLSANQRSSIMLRLTDYLSDKANTLYKSNEKFREQLQGKNGRLVLSQYMINWSKGWFEKDKWKFVKGGATEPLTKEILFTFKVGNNTFPFYWNKDKTLMMVDHITDFRGTEFESMYDKTDGVMRVTGAATQPIIKGWNDKDETASINQIGRKLLKDWKDISIPYEKEYTSSEQHTMGGAIDANIHLIDGYEEGGHLTSFPTDDQVKEMGYSKFYDMYLRGSYMKEYGSLDGFDKWQKSDPSSYSTCANNAEDVYEMIVNEEAYKDGGVPDSPLNYGDPVEVTETSDETTSYSASPKYSKGEKGYITGIKERDGKLLFTVQGRGMIPMVDVPLEHIKKTRTEAAAKVDKILDEKQEKKKFKDVGKRVRGSKKESRAYTLITSKDLNDLELDEATAIKLITKDRVYPEINVAEQRAAGVSAGAAYMKVKIREACGSKPPNDKRKRSSFVKFIEEITKAMDPLKTVKEIEDYLDTWDKIDMWTLLKFFFDVPDSEQLDPARKEYWEGKFKGQFNYISYNRLFLKAVEEVFGKRFENFITFSSDPSKIVRQEARNYEALNHEQANEKQLKYIGSYKRVIDANKENIANYEKASETELKEMARSWSGLDTFVKAKDWAAVKRLTKNNFDKRIREAEEKMANIPDAIKAHEDDWSWFDGEKEKKEVKKTGELAINTWTPLSYIKRTGGYVVKEEYVAESQNTDPDKNPITRDLGFKTVQFGNALHDKEAREHVRHFLGAAIDLADILDIDISALNGVGGLSLAFAARGSRGASAHYERGHTIINITNRNGDGSIAHEMWHYIDNAMTIFGKSAVSLDYASDVKKVASSRMRHTFDIESFISNERLTNIMVDLMDFIFKGKEGVTPALMVRFYALPVGSSIFINGGKKEVKQKSAPTYYDEVDKAYKPIELKATIEETFDYLRTRTQCVRVKDYKYPDIQAKVIGYVIAAFDKVSYELPFPYGNQSAYYFYCSQMSSSYWIKPTELCARAFECYIFDKLQVKGRMNNYLVSGEYFDQKIRTKDGGATYVYPFGAEREFLYDLFDILFNAIKEEFKLADFKPFTSVREDEYIALTASGKESSSVEVETKMEDGGPTTINGYDETKQVLMSFESNKDRSAAHGGQKWVNRIPKSVTDTDLDFIPAAGMQEKRISNVLLYGFSGFNNDQRRKMIRGLMDGQLKVLEIFAKGREGYTLIKTSDLENAGIKVMAKGGDVSEDTKIDVWSRPATRGNLNFYPWSLDKSYPISHVEKMFGYKPGPGEAVFLNGYDYAWFPEGEDPNAKKKERLHGLIYDKIVRDMNDLGKDHFTEDSFEDWWSRTRIDDEGKDYVKDKLIEKGLMREEKFEEGGGIERSLREINNEFNERLKKIIGGKNNDYRVLYLGHPSKSLLASGFPNLPIEMSIERLIDKKLQSNHPFSLVSVVNMPEHLADPIAIFQSKTRINSKVVLTEMESNGVNMVAAIELFREKRDIEINDIRSVYPKDNIREVLSWIVEHDLLEYCNKKKALNWLGQQQSNSAEVTKTIKDTVKVINNFENPAISAKNKGGDNHGFASGGDLEEDKFGKGGEILNTEMQPEGKRIFHEKFGSGTVINDDGKVLKVNFDNVGEKQLFKAYAKVYLDNGQDPVVELSIPEQSLPVENKPAKKKSVKKENPTTIKSKVIAAKDVLTAMTTHTDLRQWAISNGMDNRSAFPKFKDALNEIGLDYDQIKTGVHSQKEKELEEKINYQVVLYVDAKASAERFGITDEDGNVIWHGRFFDNENAGEQSRAELEAAKKAVWLTSKIKETIGAEAIRLLLYVDAEWLTYQDHGGQKGYVLTQSARKYNIQLDVQWISGKNNPADKWTTASGFKKWSDNNLAALATPIKDGVEEAQQVNVVESKKPQQKVVKVFGHWTEYDKSYGKTVHISEYMSEQSVRRTLFFPKKVVVERTDTYIIVPEWIYDKKIKELKDELATNSFGAHTMSVEVDIERMWTDKKPGESEETPG